MRTPSISLAALLALAGCGNDAKPSKDAAPSTTADTQPTATQAATPPTAAPTASKPLKAANAKTYAHTADAELGTLPEGIGIPVGATAPDFELPAVEGGKVKLSELTKKSEVLLVFYRGGW